MKRLAVITAFFTFATALFAGEIIQPEIIVHRAPFKCDAKCAPLCGYILRIRADFIEQFNCLPEEKAAFKCSMDDQNLYVEVFMEDKDVVCEAPNSSFPKLYNTSDAVQILLKSAKHTGVWEINVTSRNISNAFFYHGPGTIASGVAEKFSVKSEVTVSGTVNNSKDIDKSWSARITIPLTILRRNGLNFRASENWTMMVVRNNYGRYISKREMSSFPQAVKNVYFTERFGSLRLPEAK